MDTLQLILSILPPIIAIGLALITKEVISSLLVGILAGTLIYSQGNVVGMVTSAFELMGSKIGDNVNILIFLGLLGALVVIVTRAGGSAAYGDWASRKISNRRGAALATSALGCLIFIDDYFNCLSVGTVMRPVTDKHRISRAKLAYLLDATAAPICIIAPVSSWGASVASYMSDATGLNGMATFVKTIPYNFYAILTIIMILVICLTKLNYGPMAKFEKNAIEKGDLFSNTENIVTEDLGGVAGTSPELSNANLGVSGNWWIYYGKYQSDALYVNSNGAYSSNTYSHGTANYIPAIRIQGYMNVAYTPVYGGGLAYHEAQTNVNSGDVVGELQLLGEYGNVSFTLSPSSAATGSHQNDYREYLIKQGEGNLPSIKI